jgi:predicted MFS family arabinose efflux permease
MAMNLVDTRRRGRAVAAVSGRLTVALVIEVPLGTFLGQQFTWRVPFFTVAGPGLAAMIANIARLPGVSTAAPVPLRRQLAFPAS